MGGNRPPAPSPLRYDRHDEWRSAQPQRYRQHRRRAANIPGTLGRYQVNFRLPVDTLTGSVALRLSVGMAVDTSVKLFVQ